VACDVAKPDAVKSAFREVFARAKRLDVLVNNAGVLGDRLFGMVTPAELERVFAVNTFGAFHCTQYAARLMQRGGGGSVINVASVVARTGEIGLSAYGASKAALVGLTHALAKELAPGGVRVNAIAAGCPRRSSPSGSDRSRWGGSGGRRRSRGWRSSSPRTSRAT
jgi:3-oxoacyl-[acyl-carrier protein] reductase